jgi:ATP-dependent Lon protease
MEILEIPGYSEFEKLEIALQFIIPKQMEENGLLGSSVKIKDDAILEIIRYYTMESGVRSLEREIAGTIRKLAESAVSKGFAEKDKKKISDYKCIVSAKSLNRIIGKRKYDNDLVFAETVSGIALGLAWTEMGGTVMPVEVSCFPGDGELILTGNLGDVMKESARAALTYLRAHSDLFNLSANVFKAKSFHIHVPEGAIPKDGPSAGITLASAIISALLKKPLNQLWAMTGEITLTGRILAIGGLKEKILAAHRNKIKKVLLPEANRKDIDEIPPEVMKNTEIVFVSTIEQAFKILLPGNRILKKKRNFKK